MPEPINHYLQATGHLDQAVQSGRPEDMDYHLRLAQIQAILALVEAVDRLGTAVPVEGLLAG